MANITGTNGQDTLTGTASDDVIKGLGGNDIIIASDGNDVIDGGNGNDTVDYSSNGIFENQVLFGSLDGSITVTHRQAIGSESFQDKLVNIETIIGRTQSDIFTRNILSFGSNQSVEVDLSKNQAVYSSPSFGTKTLTVKNFSRVITNGSGSSRIKGDDLDNIIESFGTGKKTIIGSKGNDTLAGVLNSTVDYSNIGRTISLNVPGSFGTPPSGLVDSRLNIDKSDFGIDSINRFEKIIGANNKENSINGSTAAFGSKLDVNLKNNSLNIIVPSSIFDERIEKYEVVNFVNVIGGQYNDTIVGANKNGKLTGGGGNDTITGGNRNDIITGSDNTARGVGEVDILIGGGGRDKFILGDKNGAYYVGKGKDDYATITDFNLFQDSIDLGGFKNYSFASGGGNTIELYSGKDVNTRDLIAKIQLAGGISTASSNSRSIAGSSPNLDSIISRLDIISGTSTTANA
jgi:Ca2+-binding RTX toxin-like protein